jgi:hypothetical protein
MEAIQMAPQVTTKASEAPLAPQGAPQNLVPRSILDWLQEALSEARRFVTDYLRLADTPERRVIPLASEVVATVGWPRTRPLQIVTTVAETGSRETRLPNLHDVIHSGTRDMGNLQSDAKRPFIMISPLASGPAQILSIFVHGLLDLAFPPETAVNKNGQRRIVARPKPWKEAAKLLTIDPKQLSKGSYDAPAIKGWAESAAKLLSPMPADTWAHIQKSLTKLATTGKLKPATCSQGHFTITGTQDTINSKALPVVCGACFMSKLSEFKGHVPPEVSAAVVEAVAYAVLRLKADINAETEAKEPTAEDMTKQLEAAVEAAGKTTKKTTKKTNAA